MISCHTTQPTVRTMRRPEPEAQGHYLGEQKLGIGMNCGPTRPLMPTF
jgi:hypothetical protein